MPTAIEWTDEVWNPVTGCTRVSAGCDLCYAVGVAIWQARMGREKYQGLVNPGQDHFNGVVKTHPDTLDVPLRWRKPRRIFVNSQSDLFHRAIPVDFVRAVFDVMAEAHWHVFQVLTKRPERAVEHASEVTRGRLWPPNVLMGTSVEDDRVLDRIDHLRLVPAPVRFLSCEPLIGRLGDLDLTGVHWVIVGGESEPQQGTDRRDPAYMNPKWVRDIRAQCAEAGVAFAFKQWGRIENNPDPDDPTAKRNGGGAKGGRTLDGDTWDEHPAVAGFCDPEAIGIAEPPPITDEEWDAIADVVPGRPGTPGGRGRDNRRFIDAVRWKAWTLRPWRDLPPRFGPWNTAAVREKRWRKGGHWTPVCDRLGDPLVSKLVSGR